MIRVRYDGPGHRLVVDDLEIPRGGEIYLTEEQFARVRRLPRIRFRVVAEETFSPGEPAENLIADDTEEQPEAEEGR